MIGCKIKPSDTKDKIFNGFQYFNTITYSITAILCFFRIIFASVSPQPQ